MVAFGCDAAKKKVIDLHQLIGGRARFIFVGGLHRSGTTMVADLIARAPGVGAIEGAPVPEQEGVYLQGAIPHDATLGTPGAFAHDPAQHLTEASDYNRLDVADRIRAEWAPWYPSDAAMWVEKSPVNLLRTRLYQCLFPTAMFVLVVRHPLAVARATAKWSDRSEADLVAHWEAAHALLIADAPRLHNYVIVRYEDLTADPARELARVSALIGAPVPLPGEALANRNANYGGPSLAAGAAARALGYGDGVDDIDAPVVPGGAHYFRSVADRLAFPRGG